MMPSVCCHAPGDAKWPPCQSMCVPAIFSNVSMPELRSSMPEARDGGLQFTD